MRRFCWLYPIPTLLCFGAATLALILGTGTLYNRDVLNSHYPLKAAQAQMLGAGRLPLIDPFRSGGQPLVGNLNALPLYPDNVLYLAASPLWALNAHFWLHLLLAPCAGFWLGRAWGLTRPAAWAVGVTYAASGFFLSLFNLYNLVAGAALAPAFIAACLDTWPAVRRGRQLIAIGGLWLLLLLAGDPLFAALALLLAVAAGWIRHGGLPRRPWATLTALALGTVMAAPQIVEVLRILPHSFRGYWQYSVRAALSQSWDPRTALEWLVPFVFGPPDLSFWGYGFYGGNPPLLYSLYPGLLSLILVAIAGWPRRRATIWGWGAILAGGFLALGFWNPAIRALHGLVPGASLLRYPVKCWLLVALGGALLAGIGFERVLRGDGRRLLGRWLGLGALVFLPLCWWLLTAPPWLVGWLRRLDPERLAGARLDAERLRWVGACAVSLVLLAVFALALVLMRRNRFTGGAMLLLAHLTGQLFFLQPLFDSDAIGSYVEPPALLAQVPADVRVVHGGQHDLFGKPVGLAPRLPDARLFWLQRGFFAQLYPFSGIPWGRRYDFTHSPEGLDTFFTVALVQAMQGMPDADRLRVLAATGVDRFLLDRPLDPAAEPLVRRLESLVFATGNLDVYEPLRRAPPLLLAGTVRWVPQMNAGLAGLTDPELDPRTTVVVQGQGPALEGPPGQVTVLLDDVERLEVVTESAGDGVLLTERAHLPIYRATVDGAPAAIRIANLQRLAVEVPAGRHRVQLWVDRRPFYWSCSAALMAGVGLVLLGRRGRGGHRVSG